ncbi:hypothetical protein CDL15_Pgr009667 [Punica granatum]|uniref:Transmembrane protein n=1 Tax=Punica granatum TaxID=22663 RepID=A0A218WVL8_PUNGR|nr:hypothetical protein CDL15_Pgr009667 [Punica granatum]PKI56212.1 hypothetical protein CRG98_023407 [Punica granatum]
MDFPAKVALLALGLAILAVAAAAHEMTPGMDMSPSPSHHHHDAGTSIVPSVVIGAFAHFISLLVLGKNFG